MKLEGQRVLITGASSGIGLALARALAAHQARLVLCARDGQRLREAAVPATLAMACDVTDTEAVKNLLGRAVRRMGGLDILINNAGIGVYGETERTSLDDFRDVMEVNCFGAVNCLLQALPLLRESGGLVVNIVSVAAIRGVPFMGAYGASKAALVSLSQSLRSELAGSGVGIMLVYPGYTQTGFFRSEKLVGGARRPEGPYTRADTVARAVVRAMERGKRDLVLTMEGRALRWMQLLLPGLLERLMGRYAARLRI